MNRRSSGILLHVSSLPSPFGIGDFGPAAYRFADYLATAGQGFWQILPLSPTSVSHGNSPYSSFSAMAGNPLFISPEILVQDGLLDPSDLEYRPVFPEDRVDFEMVTDYKRTLFRQAHRNFLERHAKEEAFADFRARNAYWLDDYSLFASLKPHFHGVSWIDWPDPVRDREPDAIASLMGLHEAERDYQRFLQYTFFSQWGRLKKHLNERSIQVIGDIPIYVDQDSSDVWANQDLFRLGPGGRPLVVAGVPPDYFSATGQRWGNPVYDWERLEATGFEWWCRRVAHGLKLYDLLRVDHFRGLVSYWEIPSDAPTAVSGSWAQVPTRAFLDALERRFPSLPLLAEDLGTITPDVRQIMQDYDLPGMRVLLFAFGDDLPHNPYAPHNHIHDCVVYTGTHDNNTARGWLETEVDEEQAARLAAYLGQPLTDQTAARVMIRLALSSVANTCILPMQDILGLGAEARMNTPATTTGNWTWRVRHDQLMDGLARELGDLTRLYGRA